MAKTVKNYNDAEAQKIRRVYIVGWVLYFISLAFALYAYFAFPEDRATLRIFLFAFVGPIIAQSYTLPDIIDWPWLKRFPVHRILIGGTALVLFYRGLTGTRQDCYVYFLLAMGPLFYASNRYAVLRARSEALER